MVNKTTLNNEDISNYFEVTCKKCGSKDVEIYGGSMNGEDIAEIECKNPNCNNSYETD